jgi:hypothetical protein
MRPRIEIFVLLVLLLAGAAWAPQVGHAKEYLLFTSGGQGVVVYHMDDNGNLILLQEYNVGWDSCNVTVSPDGRVVAVSTDWSSPMLSVFFIGEDGSIAPPVCLDHPWPEGYGAEYDPVAFHHSLPIFYAGFDPIAGYRYSLKNHTVESTSQTLITYNNNASFTISQSPWCNALVYLYSSMTIEGLWQIQTVALNADGSFGQLNPPLSLPKPINSDFVVSPDGRWAAATTSSGDLYFIRINQDGTANLTYSFTANYNDFNNGAQLAFTSDSRHLLQAGPGQYLLRSYNTTLSNGTLTLMGGIPPTAPGFTVGPPFTLAVSPDGCFTTFVSQNYNNLAHDLLQVARIHEDGTLEYLNGKEFDVDQYISALAFVPLPPPNAAKGWGLYQ